MDKGRCPRGILRERVVATLRASGLRAGIVALALWASPAWAQAPLIDPPADTSQEILTGARPPQVVVPLVVRSGAALATPVVTRVAVGGTSMPSLVGGFRPVAAPSAIQLEVDPSVIRAPATYTVTVRLPSSDGAEAATVELALTLAPATLRPMAPVVIDHVRWPFASGALDRVIQVRETSGKTGLLAMAVEQLDPLVVDGVDAPAALTIAAPTQLGAGGSAAVRLGTRERLPVGVARGQLTISAPQLLAPGAVPVEIRTRIDDSVIVVWFLIWGVLGWFVRHWLTARVARAEILASMAPLLARVRRQERSHPDPAVVRDLGQRAQALGQAIETGSQAELEAAAAALQQALAEAESGRAALVTAGFERIAALAQAVDVGELPAGVDVAAVIREIEQARRALLRDDPAAAERLERAAVSRLQEVAAALATWAADARDALRSLQDLGLPAAPRPLPGLPARLDAIVGGGGAADAAALAALLRGARQAYVELTPLATQIAAAVAAEAGRAVAAWGAGAPADLVSAATAEVRGGDPVASLRASTVAFRAYAKRLGEQLTDARARQLALTGQLAEAVRAQRTADAGVDAHQPAGAVRGTPAGMGAPPPITGPFGGPPPMPTGAGPVAAATAVRHEVILVPPAPLEVLLAGAAPAMTALHVVRGAASALVLALGTWAVYADRWTGTTADFVGVAVIGFFSDFTLSAVLESVARIRKPMA